MKNHLKPKIYWECNGDTYEIDPKKNYLIYFSGCFCPPHRGHLLMIEPFLKLPNVKFLISQIGDESRHGVSYRISRKIWKIFIHELIPNHEHRVALVELCC